MKVALLGRTHSPVLFFLVLLSASSTAFSNRELEDEGEFPDVKHVVGTNRIDIAVNEDHRTGRYIFCSAEDNLLKGAGGQAVQSMNICQGYDEGTGLP